jgi:hypothetical protein
LPDASKWLHRHQLVDQTQEGDDAGLGDAAAPGDATQDVPGAQVLQGAAPDVTTALAWVVGILVVTIPTATYLFRRAGQ